MTGRWVTPEEWDERKTQEEATARAAYTWKRACEDLALLTNLTVLQAADVTERLHGHLHPYDTVPWLRDLLMASGQLENPAAFGRALHGLVTRQKHRQIWKAAESTEERT